MISTFPNQNEILGILHLKKTAQTGRFFKMWTVFRCELCENISSFCSFLPPQEHHISQSRNSLLSRWKVNFERKIIKDAMTRSWTVYFILIFFLKSPPTTSMSGELYDAGKTLGLLCGSSHLKFILRVWQVRLSNNRTEHFITNSALHSVVWCRILVGPVRT